MYAFDYKRPKTLAEAEAALATEEAKLLAGGQTLIPTLKQRLANPSELIDIANLPELQGITVKDGVVSIGAMTKHAWVARSAEVKAAIPALCILAGGIGDRQVRNMGTMGGSLANNDPSADYPGGVMGLNATIHTSRRAIAADDYFLGLFETALEEGEILTRVDFPIPKKAGYKKFPNPASRYCTVGVMAAQTNWGVRVGVTGAGPCAFRWTEAEEALTANWSPDAVAELTLSPDGLNSDIHASAEYRAHLVMVMTKRAVMQTL